MALFVLTTKQEVGVIKLGGTFLSEENEASSLDVTLTKR